MDRGRKRENIPTLVIMHFLGRKIHEFLPQGLFMYFKQ